MVLLRRLVWALGWTGPIGLAVLPGCDESGPRVYTAQAYEPANGCLDDYVPVGLVMSAALFPTCDPVCLELGNVLYVSTVCAPYPATAVPVAPEDSTDCATALALATSDTGGLCSALDASPASDDGGGGDDGEAGDDGASTTAPGEAGDDGSDALGEGADGATSTSAQGGTGDGGSSSSADGGGNTAGGISGNGDP
jgi:hypothetical protein